MARTGPVEGARLTRIGNEIWVADRELILPAGARLPIRMVVLRDPARRLLCYSPVHMDAETLEALTGLGEVTWLVVPSRLHDTFLPRAIEAFPDARVLGCAELWSNATDETVEIPSTEGTLCGFVDYRLVRASSRFTELVLYHDGSETLVVSDLLFNVTVSEPRLRWWLKLNGAWGGPGQTRLRRLLHLRDGRALTAFYRWAMARPFRQISVSHGAIIRDEAREVLYRLFRPAGQRW